MEKSKYELTNKLSHNYKNVLKTNAPNFPPKNIFGLFISSAFSFLLQFVKIKQKRVELKIIKIKKILNCEDGA